jgi:hypothetical protein
VTLDGSFLGGAGSVRHIDGGHSAGDGRLCEGGVWRMRLSEEEKEDEG